MLDMLTNDMVYAWIQGKANELDNAQNYLYRKFKSR